MRFASFEVTDIDKVNKFLEANADGVAKDGMVIADGRITFVYMEEEDAEEQQRYFALNALKEKLAGYIAALINLEVDILYALSMKLKGDLRADDQLKSYYAKRETLKLQISQGNTLLAQITGKKYSFEHEDRVAASVEATPTPVEIKMAKPKGKKK